VGLYRFFILVHVIFFATDACSSTSPRGFLQCTTQPYHSTLEGDTSHNKVTCLHVDSGSHHGNYKQINESN